MGNALPAKEPRRDGMGVGRVVWNGDRGLGHKVKVYWGTRSI